MIDTNVIAVASAAPFIPISGINRKFNIRFVKKTEEKKYWITMNTTAWVITLVVSFFVFFPGFVALLILWAIKRAKVQD